MTITLRTTKGSQLTTAELDGNFQDIAANKADALAAVSLSANTTLTRAAHYNRLIVVNVTAGNVTLTATGTDALLGDFISIDVIGTGSNTVTLSGVTAQTGYTLSAVVGGNVEARCDVAASFIASTRATSAAGATATLALVDGDFTSNNLNLTATHTNRVLDCSAVTIPVTLTIQTDASGGYDTTAAEIKVLGSLTAPVAIIKGTGATLVGEVQVIEQGAWGGARRKGTDAWAIVGQRKSGLSLCSVLSQHGFSVPNGTGGTSVTTIGFGLPNPIDACTPGGAAAPTDGTIEYGAIRRIRYTGASTAANRAAGWQNSLVARMESVNSSFPMSFAAGIADAGGAATFVMGLCNNPAVGTGMNAIEPSSAYALDLVALGADSTDSNMQLMTRNGSSAISATKVDLGASFPKTQWYAYQLNLYKNNAGTAFLAVVMNMNTKAVTAKILTSNLPRPDRSYATIYDRSNLATGVAPAIDFIATSVGASS